MNHNPEADKRKPTGDDPGLNDDIVAKLMNIAGTRAAIPVDAQARVHEKVEREWRNTVLKSRVKQWTVPLALAASLLVTIAVLVSTGKMPEEPLGTIVRVTGGAPQLRPNIVLDQPVYVGDVIRTAHGQRASIVLAEAGSLRLAENTMLYFDDADEFTLERGQVYADSGRSDLLNDGMTIHTELGSVTDVGTQFSVRYEKQQVGVAVREGRVDISGDQNSYTALAGDWLTVQPNGTVSTGEVSANDDSWDWAIELAPDFEIESNSLLEFLDWAARETGRELIYVNDETRLAAIATILHGSVSGFTPYEAIASVIETTSFDYEIDDQYMIVAK